MKWVAVLFVVLSIWAMIGLSEAGPILGSNRGKRSPIIGLLGGHRGYRQRHHGGYGGGGSFAGSNAQAGSFAGNSGFGGAASQSQAASQSSSFGFGPFSASFSASQASSGSRGGGYFP